jgi:hypothetical protein
MKKTKKGRVDFKIIVNNQETNMRISKKEIENLKKLKQVDDLLSEFKDITGRIKTKIDKWDGE